MRFTILTQVTVIAVTFFFAGFCEAVEDDVRVALLTGVDYTSGEYGGADDIEDTYFPVTAKVDYGRLGFRLTVPYLRVRAPSGTVVLGPGGQPIAGSGDIKTESGLGDIVGGVTLYDVIHNADAGIFLDVTAKIKFPTADEKKGLGTGETDYSVQADFYKYVDDWTLLMSAGYKLYGDSSGVSLDNAFFWSIGGVYQLAPQVRGGLIFDFRESAFSSGDSIQELTAFLSRQLNDAWRIQVHMLTGFSDASPDWGSGFMVKYSF